MRELSYYVGVTLDGYIAGPNEEVDFFPTSTDHLVAMNAEYPETVPGHLREPFGVAAANRHFDTVVMGRGTYEPALREGITSPYPHLRQIVFSTTLGPSPDLAVEVVATDPIARIRALKAEAGKGIYLAGGGRFAGAIWPEIDRFILKVYPVMAGDGIRLAERGFDPTRLELLDSATFANGCAVLTYRTIR